MSTNIETIEKHLDFWKQHNNLPSENNEDIIAFIGPTKAGKSTLINGLMKTPLISKKCDGELFIAKSDLTSSGPKIGEDLESQTALPERCGELHNSHLVMYDFPGFGDNKGPKQEVANAIAMKAILCQQKSVRFALVVPMDTIKDINPFPFFELLSSLLNISSNIANHLFLVASKIEKGNLKKILENLTKKNFPNSNVTEMIEEAKEIINILLANNALISFKIPCLDNGPSECPYTLPNENDFQRCLQNITGINIAHCNLVISAEAKMKLAELYDFVYMYSNAMIDSFIRYFENCNADIINNPNIKDKKETFKCFIEEYKNLCTENSLPELINNLNTASSADAIIKNFHNLEYIRNYSSQPIHGKDEFVLKIRCSLENAIKLLNNEIKIINIKESYVSKAEEVKYQQNQEKLKSLRASNILEVCGIVLSLFFGCLAIFFPEISIPLLVGSYTPAVISKVLKMTGN